MTRLGQTVSILSAARKAASRKRPARAPGVLRDIGGVGQNPGGLRCLAYKPEWLAPSPALVVALHGCTQTAEGYARGSGWIEAADRHGFLLLCPEQTSANNPNLCFNWFNPGDTARGKGEAASIAEMIEHVIAEHGVAKKRVFITGLSAGGAMANAMLATYPEIFAAGAIMAGLAYGVAGNVHEAFSAMSHQRDASDDVLGARIRDASAHKGPWPRISVWHGDADTTVSPAAGHAVARQWVNVHGAVDTGAPNAQRSQKRTWLAPGGEVVVAYRRLPGMGHGVALGTGKPDSVGMPGPFMLDIGVSSTLEVLADWGLTDYVAPNTAAARSIDRKPHVASSGPAPRQATRPAPAQPATIDIGETINNALRAAGLLK